MRFMISGNYVHHVLLDSAQRCSNCRLYVGLIVLLLTSIYATVCNLAFFFLTEGLFPFEIIKNSREHNTKVLLLISKQLLCISSIKNSCEK